MTDWDGMSGGEIQRRLDEAMTRLKAVADAEEHVHLEQMAAASPDHSWPPAPNTEHPWMALHAAFVRDWMRDDSRHQVLLPAPRKPLYRFISDPEVDVVAESHEHLVLDIRKCVGLAPYVGDPFIWVWKVAVDKHSRWVAGDSWPVDPVTGWERA